MIAFSKGIKLFPGAFGILVAAASIFSCSRVSDKPNIVIIYADDPGYGDIVNELSTFLKKIRDGGRTRF